MLAYSGSGAGFVRLPFAQSLYRHTNFNDSFVYKKVNTPQEAVACGGLAIFSADGTYCFIVGGEALQAWAQCPSPYMAPYQAMRRKLISMGDIGGIGTVGDVMELDTSLSKWLDFGSLASAWHFMGVVTKATSLIGLTANMRLRWAIDPGFSGTVKDAFLADNRGYNVPAMGGPSISENVEQWRPRGGDAFAAWVGVPFHESIKVFIKRTEVASIGGGEGEKFVRDAHATLFPALADTTPLLNLIICGLGNKVYSGRNPHRAVCADVVALGRAINPHGGTADVPQSTFGFGCSAINGIVSAWPDVPVDNTNGLLPAHAPGNAYITEYLKHFNGRPAIQMSPDHEQTLSMNLNMPWMFARSHSIGTPCDTAYGRVPGLGVWLHLYPTATHAARVDPWIGTKFTETTIPAKIGGWDLRPFLSTVFPRWYFSMDTGAALPNVGAFLTAEDILSNAEQVALYDLSVTPKSTYVGEKGKADARSKVDVALPVAERWPFDVVSMTKRYWDSVYTLAEANAKK